MYDETRGPRMGRGGGDVLVVPVMTAMLSAETAVAEEAARDDEDERADGICSRMPPLTQVKPRVAATTAEQQLLRDRRWAIDTARRGDFVMLVLGVLGVANGLQYAEYELVPRYVRKRIPTQRQQIQLTIDFRVSKPVSFFDGAHMGCRAAAAAAAACGA